MNPLASVKFLNHPNLGLLIIRIMMGVVGVLHGGQKIFGVWGGKGMPDFVDGLTKMNVPLPTVSAWLAALAEFGGGILIALGFFTRVAAFFFAFTMVVAWGMAHKFSFDHTQGGSDFPFALALVAIGLLFTGPGKYSVTALITKPNPV